MRGVVQSGGTAALHIDGSAETVSILPLSGVQVTLFDANEGHPWVVGHATTDDSGAFLISADRDSDGIFYVTADAGGGVVLMALIGPVLPPAITINELTTVAAVYCAAQFLVIDGAIEGPSAGLRIAAGMSTNVVQVSTGECSPVLLSPPNADETNALRSTRALANVLASCVRFPETGCAALYELATLPGGDAPANTIAAMFNIARHPANHVEGIHTQSQALEIYQPSLRNAPDAWTLAVKVNDSGDDDHMFGGPANIVFDEHGRAWITNNVVQGTLNSTEWCIVLGPEGRPAVDDDGNRISPFTGAGLLGAGFGVDLDRQGRVWIGNFGWGSEDYYPDGSVSLFLPDATPVAGYSADLFRVQQTIVDGSDNVWLASYGNSRVVVYPGGDSTTPICYQGGLAGDKGEGLEERLDTFLPFGIAMASDGSAWVTNSNSLQSSICNFQIVDGALQLVRETKAGRTAKGIAIDSNDTIWIGSGGDNYVYAFESDGTLIGGFQHGGLDGPWGVTVDGDDHVWAANFGPLQKGSNFPGRLTKLAGANPDTLPDGVKTGDPLTPPTGYTLPTAGDEVRLHNGVPLYAGDGPPCFTPMMRTTSVTIDAAGNLWTCNNWKPDFDIDRDSNPGGDGIVIFLGLAKPPR